MSGQIKIDLHIHTGEDPQEDIEHTAYDLIDRAAELDFDALCITNHDIVTYDDNLKNHADSEGILLIPGMEAHVSGNHILIINPGPGIPSDRKIIYDDLDNIRDEGALLIAPHPFFPGPKSLKLDLHAYHELFDAIEFSQYYNIFLNFNRRAVQASRKYDKPLVGSSDSHYLWQFGRNYSVVEADRNIQSIIQGIRDGRIEVHSPPQPVFMMAKTIYLFFAQKRFKRGRSKGN